MMTYFIASAIKCCPGEEQRSRKAYDKGPASLEGQRRFPGDVGGGGRALVRSLKEVSVTGPGNCLYARGEDNLSDPRNMMETTLTHTEHQQEAGW